MSAASRRSTAFAAALAVVIAAAGTAFGLLARDGDPTEDAAASKNSARFLALTGDADAVHLSTAGPGALATEEPASVEAVADCADDPATVEVLPNGWCLRPAGTQIDVARFPLGLAPTTDGSMLVTSDSGGLQALTRIDGSSLTAVPTPAQNLFMGLAVTPTGRVYAAGGNANRVFRFEPAGPAFVTADATEAEPFPMHGALDRATKESRTGARLPAGDGIAVTSYPGPMALDGEHLYVSGTLSEPSGDGDDACPGVREVCGRVSVIDTGTDAVVRRIPVGYDPMGLAVAGDRLYVANWADEAQERDGSGTGSVSVVDISDPAAAGQGGEIAVGHHPTALQLSGDGTTLFVANTNDDTISVIDLDAAGGPAVVATPSVSPVAGVPVGAHPDAFALSPDGNLLFVALAGLNAVEIRDGHTGQRISAGPTYIPTGWYPSALAVTPVGDQGGYRLWVANAKGIGPGPGINLSVGPNGTRTDGTVSVIDMAAADEATIEAWTDAVFANDGLDRADVDVCEPGPGVRVSQVLCPPESEDSPVKHVVYIVTENKTFDQYFGDLDPAQYDADPTWLLYGQPVTPNHHALVGHSSLGDNFYSDAEASVTGHSWTSGAIATDHNERTWQADYDQGIRGSHGNGDPVRGGAPTDGEEIQNAENELNDPEGGYIFEAFADAGAAEPADAAPGSLSMAIYGEGTAVESGTDLNGYKVPAGAWSAGDLNYFDTCRAWMFINGQAPTGPIPPYLQQSVPVPFGPSNRDCEGRSIPAEFSLAHWSAEARAGRGDQMPSFIYMTLTTNHTLGTNVGSPTPASMVADNDYAVGLIIDALSKSPFWESTVVIQTEDDTQLAGDHVSSQRDYVQVTGPWAEPGPMHQWGSMPSILRTVEQLFGVEPISLFDRLALPLHEAFRASLGDTPDTSEYNAVVPLVPFNVNQPNAVGAEESATLDFSSFDLIDEGLLNRILYASIRGWSLETGRPPAAGR